ncbi:MAG TPA: ABC transporter substrate-binding protein, partial [Acidimicrobiia bacterium]|nr:ABC transporter substrate-binding protein [Acidimicrobiia bacterium]
MAKTSIRASGLALLLAMTAAGCGTTEKDLTASPVPADVSAGRVKDGGVWRESLHGDPTSLDPAFGGHGGYKLVKLLFTGLTTFEQNRDLTMHPGVAERWSSNPGCTVWTFSLRRSTFSNDEPVTAESFIRGWTRAADGRAASPFAYHLSVIQGYDALHGTASAPPSASTFSGLSAPDPQTLVVRLNAADCEFDKRTLHIVYSPVPSVAGSADDRTYNEAPIGNGPFMLKPSLGWEHEKRISLVRNDSYFGAKPHLDGIEFVIFAHGTPAPAPYPAFQAGELDVASVPIGIRRAAEARYSPQGAFLLQLPFTVSYLAPNNARPPLNNPDARRAISLAIDREAIAQALGEGVGASVGAGATSAFVGPPFGSYHQRGVCDACRYDPAAAKELASRSGLGPGTQIRLLGSGALVQAYKQQIETSLGIVVEADGLAVNEKRDRGDFDLYPTTWTADYPTPDTFLGPLLGKGSPENFSRYDNVEYE